MKKAFILFTALCLVLSLSACGGGEPSTTPATTEPSTAPATEPSTAPTTEPSTAPATEPSTAPTTEPSTAPTTEPKSDPYMITYANARTWTNSIGSVWVQTIIEVTNTGDDSLFLSSGSYDLEKADGSLVEARSFVSVYPTVIDPGEKAYYYEETPLDNDPGEALIVVPHLQIDKAKVDNIRFPLSDIEIRDKQYGGLEAIGRVENNGSEAESMIYIAIMLYDSDNIPIGLLMTILSNEVAVGDKVGFEANALSLPSEITADSVDHFEAFAYPLQMQF